MISLPGSVHFKSQSKSFANGSSILVLKMYFLNSITCVGQEKSVFLKNEDFVSLPG